MVKKKKEKETEKETMRRVMRGRAWSSRAGATPTGCSPPPPRTPLSRSSSGVAVTAKGSAGREERAVAPEPRRRRGGLGSAADGLTARNRVVPSVRGPPSASNSSSSNNNSSSRQRQKRRRRRRRTRTLRPPSRSEASAADGLVQHSPLLAAKAEAAQERVLARRNRAAALRLQSLS